MDTEDETARLERLAKAATPGPWHACTAPGCKCTQIMCDDYPVCNVTKGAWGDDFPSIRLEGSSLELKAFAYMDQITYGEVSVELAMANREFISAANPAAILRIATELATLRAEVERLRGKLEDVAAWHDVQAATAKKNAERFRYAETTDFIQRCEASVRMHRHSADRVREITTCTRITPSVALEEAATEQTCRRPAR